MLHVVSFKNALCDVEIRSLYYDVYPQPRQVRVMAHLSFLYHSADQSGECRTDNGALGMMRILHQVQGVVIR